LSIVKAVAEMHGGSVFVACSGGINTFGFSVSTQPCSGGPLRTDDAGDPQPLRPAPAPRALH
ncbi:two-component sensor histidine kinase, partial [Burkholderia pseudomallei]|nr:two-component sensor histidine kinase [Burkholderia pseudomallei]